jgi:hypothetical protein
VLVGQGATIFYFLFFVILIPAIGIFEAKLLSVAYSTESNEPQKSS